MEPLSQSEQLKVAFSSLGNASKGLYNWGQEHPVLSTGASMVPGVGAALSLNDASNDFGQGKYWSGLGNLGFAGLNLVGGGLIKGLGKGLMGGTSALLERGGAKALGKVPQFGSWTKALPYGIGKMLNGGSKLFGMADRGLGAMGRLEAGVIAQSPRLTRMNQWMHANPFKSMGIYTGVGVASGAAQAMADNRQRNQASLENSSQNVTNWLNQFRNTGNFNPIWHNPAGASSGEQWMNEFQPRGSGSGFFS